jgi:pilus assembly protein Flp/PilA
MKRPVHLFACDDQGQDSVEGALLSPPSARATAARRMLGRLVREDSGQDTVEYALLAGLIGIASIVAWQQVAAAVGNAYGAADAAVQSLADPANPLP